MQQTIHYICNVYATLTCVYQTASMLSCYHGAADCLVEEMDSNNYLSPDFPQELIKSENLSNLFEKTTECDDLIECIEANDLSELRQYFYPKQKFNLGETQHYGKNYDNEGISLGKKEFTDIIQQMFGKDYLKVTALKFFEDLQRRKTISNSISWYHIIEAIIEKSKIQRLHVDAGKKQCILNMKGRYSLPQRKEFLVQILILETDNSFCYTAISISGSIGIYDANMNLCDSYEIPFSRSRKMNKWISSASHTCIGHAIFISTYDRCLYVYNTSRLNHRLRFIISELPCTITCMEFGQLRSNEKLLLFIGDDVGNIFFLIFHQHFKSFFKENPNKEVGCYFWHEIKHQTKWVSFHFVNRVHNEFVMDIKYIPKNNAIISFSKDSFTSVVITYLEDRKMVKSCQLKKGLQCFAYDHKLGFLATSSSDNIISLWNSKNPDRPINHLYGHEKNIIDLHFLMNLDALLSISEEGVLKIWNMLAFKCLQTIQIESFSAPKNYLYSNIIFVRLITDLKNLIYKDKPSFMKRTAFEVLVTSSNTVTMLTVNNGNEPHLEKPLPIRNLEAKVPDPNMIFKHCSRANKLSCEEFQSIEIKRQCIEFEKQTEGIKQYIKKGASHLGLMVHEVNENIATNYESILQY